MRPEVGVWIAKAEEDRLAAEWLLKGYLTSEAIRFEKKHDLTYLISLLPEPAFEAFYNFCDELSPFSVEIRYPGDLPPITRIEGLALLDQLYQFREVIYRFLDSQSDSDR